MSVFHNVTQLDLFLSKPSSYAAIKMSLSFMVSVQVFIGVPALLVLIAAFLVVMPVVDNPQVRKEQVDFDDDDALKYDMRLQSGLKLFRHSLVS